ncbi:MAG: hypothetical protein CFE21_08285 [Bacteroidetes bacterium B1(2017)]|nr:MAG: hypothetical protein CFE21_08285 [Bacteroidetes bacterium B1(2017)]
MQISVPLFMIKYLVNIGLFLILPAGLLAQSEGGSNVLSPGQLWNEIAISQHTSQKFVTQVDLQWSGSNDVTGGLNIGKYTINYGARVWEHYYLKPNLKLSAFLGYWVNPNVFEINQRENTEARLALQGQYLFQRNRYSFYNRLRYERRALQAVGSSIENRFRYMPKLLIGLNTSNLQAKTVYAILSDEVFMKVNAGNFIDQNRFTAGLGYYFNDYVTLEIAYVNRFVSNQNASNEFMHAASISLGISDVFNY